MKLVYSALFSPCEEGGYTVTVPALPGCVTEGDTLSEAIFMVQDAASAWVLDELEEGRMVPEDSKPGEIVPGEGEFVSLIALDMDSYSEKYGRKAVRKNVTIPAWLNTYGESRNLNFSQILTDALQQRYPN